MTEQTSHSGLLSQVSALEEELRQLREDLAEMRARALSGKFDAPQNASKIFSTIRTYIRLALETEARLAELNSKHNKIAQGGYAVDLEQARAEVGCRLAALRSCCQDG